MAQLLGRLGVFLPDVRQARIQPSAQPSAQLESTGRAESKTAAALERCVLSRCLKAPEGQVRGRRRVLDVDAGGSWARAAQLGLYPIVTLEKQLLNMIGTLV